MTERKLRREGVGQEGGAGEGQFISITTNVTDVHYECFSGFSVRVQASSGTLGKNYIIAYTQ